MIDLSSYTNKIAEAILREKKGFKEIEDVLIVKMYGFTEDFVFRQIRNSVVSFLGTANHPDIIVFAACSSDSGPSIHP